MRCDVVAVGTELLLGQIVDTNSAFIGEQLAANGFDSLLQVKVGDNLQRIVDALRAQLRQADAVIVCGGLGPTHDDITREAIASVMGAGLHLDEERRASLVLRLDGVSPRLLASDASCGRSSQCQGSPLTVRTKPNSVAFVASQR